MKITSIKTESGRKLYPAELEIITKALVARLHEAGYITEGKVKNSSRIDLGLHMRSFKVDVTKLGYNASYNPHMSYKAGYRRTSTPTWEQRVEYNNLINEILDKYNLSANIKSGDYTIRKELRSYNGSDWNAQKPQWQRDNEMRGYVIKSMP